MKSALLFAVCLILLSSCGGKEVTDNDSDTTSVDGNLSRAAEAKFERVIQGIPIVKLPLEVGAWPRPVGEITDSITLAFKEQFSKEHNYNRSIWGRVYIGQSNVYLLATQPDDQGTVFLCTFDRSGKLLNDESLQRGPSWSAPIELVPHNYPILHADMRFTEIDTLFKYPRHPDTGEEFEGDTFYKVTRMEYAIGVDGKFEGKVDTTGFIQLNSYKY